MVTIKDFTAIPNAITRKQGQLFLLLINKTHVSPASLTLDSTTAPAAQISALGSALNLPALANVRHLASIFNAPPGVYQLKRKADGTVLLTITIEE